MEIDTCMQNLIGTASNVKPEGTKRIWERSIRKSKLRFTEFYGNGDSKSFLAVKETYKDTKIKNWVVAYVNFKKMLKEFQERGNLLML